MKNVEDTGKKSKSPNSHIGYTTEDSPKTEWILFFQQILKIPEIYVEANVI